MRAYKQIWQTWDDYLLLEQATGKLSNATDKRLFELARTLQLKLHPDNLGREAEKVVTQVLKNDGTFEKKVKFLLSPEVISDYKKQLSLLSDEVSKRIRTNKNSDFLRRAAEKIEFAKVRLRSTVLPTTYSSKKKKIKRISTNTAKKKPSGGNIYSADSPEAKSAKAAFQKKDPKISQPSWAQKRQPTITKPNWAEAPNSAEKKDLTKEVEKALEKSTKPVSKKKAERALKSAAKKVGGRILKKVPVIGWGILASSIATQAEAASKETDPQKKEKIYASITDEIIAASPVGIPYDVMKLFFAALKSNISSDPEKARVVHHNKRAMLDLL